MQVDRYNSGQDFVLECGEFRQSFSESDFGDRVEYAAKKLRLVANDLNRDELSDLVNFTLDDESATYRLWSPLGYHLEAHRYTLPLGRAGNIKPGRSPLVHWLSRLVFQGAWLDSQLNAGILDVEFDEQAGDFEYVGNVSRRPFPLTAQPAWRHVAYRPKPDA